MRLVAAKTLLAYDGIQRNPVARTSRSVAGSGAQVEQVELSRAVPNLEFEPWVVPAKKNPNTIRYIKQNPSIR